MNERLEDIEATNDRLQILLNSLAKCKIEFQNEKEELKNLREVNSKLEMEVKEVKELEKSHRYHLQTSREMIGNLQETVSQLVHLKRDNKRLKDELTYKELYISNIEKDKEAIIQQNNENVSECLTVHEKKIEEVKILYDKKVQQILNESDTQVAQFKCVIEELRSNIKEMEKEHRDKMNVVVLEYEEKIQRSAAQITQLQDQLARQASRADSNIDTYRRRLEELEEKLKQSQFKQYLVQNSYGSQYENQVERPYSVNRDYSDNCSVDIEPVYEGSKEKNTPVTQNKVSKQSTLQVMYYGNKTPKIPKPPEKKGPFNITKKRKLYNEKDFQDF